MTKRSKSDNEATLSIEQVAFVTDIAKREVKKLSENVKTINWLMAGVVIVCLIAFVQMVIDVSHFNSASYEEFTLRLNEAKSNQERIDLLLEENEDLRIENSIYRQKSGTE